jgi:hypothetical protein
VVAGDRVVGEALHELRAAVPCRVLERADTQVTRRDPREHRAGQHRLPHHVLAGGHDGQRPRGRDAQGVHRLTDDVLTQHRADGGLAIAASRKRRAPRTLQVQIAPASVDVEHLAEQERPAVAEARREPAELVARIGLRHRRRALGHGAAGEDGDAVRCPQRLGVEAQVSGEPFVERQQPGCGHRRRLPRLVQALEVSDVGVVECEQRACGDGHRVSLTTPLSRPSR